MPTLVDPRVFGAAPAGLRRERIEASPQYHDGRFRNTDPLASTMENRPLRERISVVGEFFFGRSRRTPAGALPVESPLSAWASPVETGLRATWLGHSTVLLEIDGARVLTDPVWGERIGPFSFAGPKRFHRAPVGVAELPALDAVLVSHDHFDHLDYPTIVALAAAQPKVPFVTSLGVGAHLEAWGVSSSRIRELDWWEDTRIGPLAFTAAPSRHFSGRGSGANRTLWSSWSIRGDGHAVFFSGDTGLTREFEDVGARLGPFDLVMLEVGAHHPAWGQIHLGPDNALVAHRMLSPRSALLPVHWGTFDLALHPWEEPIERLATIASDVHLVTPRLGRAFEPSRVETIDPWWRSVRGAEAPSPELLGRRSRSPVET